MVDRALELVADYPNGWHDDEHFTDEVRGARRCGSSSWFAVVDDSEVVVPTSGKLPDQKR
jgi:hypothetical protein